MSIALMSQAWKVDLPAASKLALLAMCDWANDDGDSLHPSIKAIAQRVGVSDRHAKRVVHELIDDGWLYVTGNMFGGAPGTVRTYRINLKKLSETGDTHVTGDKLSRVTNEVQTGDVDVQTGDTYDTPPPPRRVTPMSETGDTHVTQSTIEPPIRSKEKTTRAPARKPPGKPGDVSDSVWADFLAIRQAKRSPLTATALRAIESEAEKAGLTLNAALVECCARGWQGFRADWIGPKPRASPVVSLAERRGQDKRDFWEQINGKTGAVSAAIDGEAVRVD